MELSRLTIQDVTLSIRQVPGEIAWYKQRGVFEERASGLYSLLKDNGFSAFVDVGANYGYISILARKANPQVKLFALEADPRLVPIIRENLLANGIDDFALHNVIAAAGDLSDASSL